MNFLKFFKAQQRATFNQLGLLLLSVFFLPLVIGLYMSYTAGAGFNPKVTALEIKTYVDNKEEGETREVLDKYFTELENRKVLKLTDDKEKADFELIIPNGYFKGLEKDEKLEKITIERHAKTSSLEFEVIKIIAKSLIENKLKINSYKSLLSQKSLNEDEAEDLFNEITVKSNVLYKENKYEGPKAINGVQYYSVNSLLYVFFIIFASVMSMCKKEFKALSNRLTLIPLSTTKREIYGFISDYITFYSIATLYMIAFKLIDRDAFSGSFLNHMILNLVILSIVLSFAYLIGKFMSESMVDLSNTVVSLLFVFLSGMLPMDRMLGKDSLLAKFYSNNIIKTYLMDPHIGIIQARPISDYFGKIAIMLILSIVFVSLSIYITKKREEY